MCRESKINQFIPLHFYEVSEKLPGDDSQKIVICDNGEFYTGYYGPITEMWFIDTLPIGFEYNVIAWATFDAEWVTGSYPGKWGTQ